jgi:hypothetical protein
MFHQVLDVFGSLCGGNSPEEHNKTTSTKADIGAYAGSEEWVKSRGEVFKYIFVEGQIIGRDDVSRRERSVLRRWDFLYFAYRVEHKALCGANIVESCELDDFM